MKQHHVALIASERDRTVVFYETLGFQVIAEHFRADKNDRIMLMSDGDTVLEIFVKPDAPERLSYPEALGLRHLAFCQKIWMKSSQNLLKKAMSLNRSGRIHLRERE